MATTPPERRIKPLYVVLGGVVIVALVGFAALTFTGGGDVPPEVTPIPRPGGLPPRAIASPAPTPVPEMEVFELFEGRDPFRPLVFAGTGAASPAPGASPAPPGNGGVTATPRPPRSGVQVEVLSVAADGSSATVRVGSQVHSNARPGQTLSAGVVIDAIEGRCVRFHRGDDRFRLCEGELVLK